MGTAFIMSGAVAYHWLSDRPRTQPIAVAAPRIDQVSALGRLEPEGEVIQVFAPTSSDGARVEILKVSHGQRIRKGDVIALLDTYERRQAALQEAQEQLKVAQARLGQVEAGAKSGEIRAQARVVDRQQVELQTETTAQEATIARLQAELRNAELEARRYQALYAEGAVSASLRDGKRSPLSPLQSVKAHLSQALLWMEAQVQQKTVQLQGIEAMLSEAETLGLVVAAPHSAAITHESAFELPATENGSTLPTIATEPVTAAIAALPTKNPSKQPLVSQGK